MSITPIEVAHPGTDEWLAARKTGIGASESAPALGRSRYKTPRDIFELKRGRLGEFEGNRQTRLGARLEPFIVEEACEILGISPERYPVPMLRHPKSTYMLATPDADLKDGALLECKNTTFRADSEWGEPGTDHVPSEYLLQVQQQLGVSGRKLGFVARLRDLYTLNIYRIEFNDALFDLMCYGEGELWERIQADDPPPIDWQHARAPQLVKELYCTVSEGVVVALPEDVARLWKQQAALKRDAEELKKQAELLRAQVLDHIGDAYAGVLPGGEKMVRRARMRYTVKEHVKDYIEAREVKYDGTRVTELETTT